MAVKENKKVKNATPTEYDSIKFKSKMEAAYYKELVKAGFKPKYEEYKFVLLPGFRPFTLWYIDGEPQMTKSGASKMIEAWTYTPDFYIKVGKYTVLFEAKGKENDVFPYKRKMFLHLIETYKNFIYVEVHNKKGLKKTIDLLNTLKQDIDEKF